MRICSLVPSATEILCALGLQEFIVGISHECYYPPEIANRPRLTQSLIADSGGSAGINRQVSQAIALNEPLYALDEETLAALKPDLVVAQSLCSVCALGADAASAAVNRLSPKPAVISLHAHDLDGFFKDIRLLGHATNRNQQARALAASLSCRIEVVQRRITALKQPPRKVVCLEWLDPLMSAGHWVPEMVELAGGWELLGVKAQPSRRITEQALLAADPEVLILMPCGFSIKRTESELPVITRSSWWSRLSAVRQGNVRLVDGPSFFNRLSVRVVDGIELLAGILHPQAGGIANPPAL